MVKLYRSDSGVPAYDVARWLAPPPPLRNIRRLPSGPTCLVQIGGSAQAGTVQEALVSDRGADSLLIFPDGTQDFDLYLGARLSQPKADFGMALMGSRVKSRWVSWPGHTRMVHVHYPLGLRAKIGDDGPVRTFDGMFVAPSPALRHIMAAFVCDLDSGEASDLLLDSYTALIALKLSQTSPQQRVAPGLGSRRLDRVLERMQNDLSEHHTLAALANEAGLSQAHFIRAFRQATGMPPHRFLNNLRVRQARHLIQTTNESISSIAASVGFQDQSYFARLFKKRLGVAPAQYRRR